jgi:hypothetical protein
MDEISLKITELASIPSQIIAMLFVVGGGCIFNYKTKPSWMECPSSVHQGYKH